MTTILSLLIQFAMLLMMGVIALGIADIVRVLRQVSVRPRPSTKTTESNHF